MPIETNVKHFFKFRKDYQPSDWKPRRSLSLLLASVMFGIGLATCASYWIVRGLILDELQNTATLEVQRSRANLENRLIGLNGLAAVLGSLLVAVTMFAVHQIHVLEQTRARAAKEALLNRISDRIRHSLLDLPAILQTTLKEVADLLELDGTTFGWLRADVPTLEVVYQHQRVPLGTLTQPLPLKDLGSLATYFLQHRPVQWGAIAQATELNDTARQRFYQLGIHSYLALPVVTHSRVGYLACIHTQPRSWSDGELELLNAVTDQLAIAIHQAHLYAETQKQVEALEHLNKLKDDFLSTVSHELRSPISNIKLITQMIEQTLERSTGPTTDSNTRSGADQPALDPEVSRYFSILKDECQREMELINNLLDLTRLDAGTEPLFPSLINLPIWLPHVAEPFMGRVQSQQQQLQIDLSDPLPALETDADYLERILRELLQNACKYTPPEGTIILSAQAIATPAAIGAQHLLLAISVTNTGVEIPPLEQTRIFDKFYRIPNGDPWRHGGTGLGLALAKRIAEYLGATLQVSSRDGKTCFTLQFTKGLQNAPPVPLSCDPLSQNLKAKA